MYRKTEYACVRRAVLASAWWACRHVSEQYTFFIARLSFDGGTGSSHMGQARGTQTIGIVLIKRSIVPLLICTVSLIIREDTPVRCNILIRA